MMGGHRNSIHHVLGGIKAVTWADVQQMIVIIFAALVAVADHRGDC